jgi:hypothetical protein
MKKIIRFCAKTRLLLVLGIVIFLVSCNSNYKKKGREKIQNFILSRADLFKPLKSDTIIIIDNDIHECSQDNRDFVDKNYTRPRIEKVLSGIGFKKIIFTSGDNSISVNGGQPISINNCGFIYPKYPAYILHIWEEILLTNRTYITINESYSNIDTSIAINYILEWKNGDFVINESETKSRGLTFEENPEKKGKFYTIDLPAQSVNIPFSKTKELIEKFGLLFEETIKNDTTFFSYAWHTYDSISPLFKINYYEKSSKSFFKPIGAIYNQNPFDNTIYHSPNGNNPDNRLKQYSVFIKTLIRNLKKFNSIDSLNQLGYQKQIDQQYVESNEIFNKILLMSPPDYAIYKVHVNYQMGINYYKLNKIDLAINHLLIEYHLGNDYTLIEPEPETCKYLSMCYKIKNQPALAKKYDEEYRNNNAIR